MLSLALRSAVAIMIAGMAFAQTDLATLRGNITDQSGAAVPNAKLTLLNTGTNIPRESVSNENGDFEIPYVVQGSYTLTVSSQGFKVFIANDPPGFGWSGDGAGNRPPRRNGSRKIV